MRNRKKIIIASSCIEFLFIVSVWAYREAPPSTWDLVRQEMAKKTEPNIPAESAKSTTSIKQEDIAETANSLLDKCTETLDKTYTSFITKSKYHKYDDYKTDIQGMSGQRHMYTQVEFRTDGKRFKSIRKKWGGDFEGNSKPESQAEFSVHIYDGNAFYQHAGPYNTPGRVSIHTKNYKNFEQDVKVDGARLSYEDPVSECFGYLTGDYERFDHVIREDGIEPMSVRKEEYKGTIHFVIEANTTHGQYQIWLNPQKGYHFSKATVTRKAGEEFNGNYKVEQGSVKNYTIENEEFKQVNDLWVSVKAKALINDSFPNNGYMKMNAEIELISILINPDHEALKSFTTDDIKDGAIVMIDGNPIYVPYNYTWQKGKVVDEYGYEVNLSTLKPMSLVGKTLPSIAEFGVDLEPSVFKNNRLLICFFDYSQKPSRNCVLTLNEKTESLLDKDIFLIFIQAESVTEQTLAAWLTKNEIVPPVGTSKTDLPALGHSWGVQSLPWLILTDKNHIVKAEGFSINDLDEKTRN
ncbi:MAG: hypothetical protein JW787_18785 [Sedimentisphaerales bacterium]|nr:hypothetical protein [Sedimentisphaerales bacterium]